MRSPSTRLVPLALAVLVTLIPACSKSQPQTIAPAPPPAVEPAPTPAPQPPPAEAPAAGEWETTDPGQSFLSPDEINARRLLTSLFFEYDSAEIRADQRAALQSNAAWLRDNTAVRILVEGHCDERGTREYNQALGDRRAQAARDFLISLGIPASRIETISYGEERPAAMGEGESNWSLNRRAEFVALTGTGTD